MTSPAALFLELWQLLEAGVTTLDRLTEEPGDAAFRRELRKLLDAQEFDYGAAHKAVSGDLRRALVAAQSIDSHYSSLSGGLPVAGLPKPLLEGRSQLLRQGSLEAGGGGGRAVILRRSLSGRWSDAGFDPPEGEGVAKYFQTLLVTPRTVVASDPDNSSAPASVSFKFVVCSPSKVRLLKPGQTWKVGVAPVVQDVGDLDVTRVEHSSGVSYDSVAADLGDRVANLVEALCKAGCHVIAFPEMALSPPTLEALKQSVAQHGPRSELRLVLAGSTPTRAHAGERPRNQSCTLNHKGEVLFVQDKLARWNLDRATCDRYGLKPATSGTLDEHIDVGSELTVAELPGIGRLATFICEDLARTEPGQWVRRHLMLDLQFTPVMDSDLHFGRWTASSGGRAANTGGCRVMVVNSLPLTIRQNDCNRDKSPDLQVQQPGIGLFFDRVGEDVKGLRIATALPSSLDPIFETADWAPATWQMLEFT